MYYSESVSLIESRPEDKDALRRLDREFAHAYHSSGQGHIDSATLAYKTGLDSLDIGVLASLYESSGVIRFFQKLECTLCDTLNHPDNACCMNCGCSLNKAPHSGLVCYGVVKQPMMPAFNVERQPDDPDVFISYKQSDTTVLASDIYYSMRSEGKKVFLDWGEILPGSMPESVYLRAASRASVFIMLVSTNYFDSPYCRNEIAHAARNQARLVRVNINPVPPAPPSMPWVDQAQWLQEKGNANGLDKTLESTLFKAVQLTPNSQIADFRLQACNYLLEQLCMSELSTVWGRISYMRGHTKALAAPDIIGQIMNETSATRLSILCNALAPE